MGTGRYILDGNSPEKTKEKAIRAVFYKKVTSPWKRILPGIRGNGVIGFKI
jgi:hypothetical protein